jgi:two-component system, cell cycle response regulator
MKKPRILVVESARTYQRVLCELAAQVGAECLIAGDVNSAIVTAETEEFDLIVVATYLPDGNGVELARACRTSLRHTATPIVLVTSDEPATLTAEALSMGVTELVARTDLPALRRHFAACAGRWSAAADARVLIIANAVPTPYDGILRSAGFAVVIHTDGKAALEDAGQGGWDLIVLEATLAVPLTCLSFVRRLRRPGHANVPILVIDNINDVALRLECMRAGANDFFAAPFAAEELVARALILVSTKRRLDQEMAAIATASAPQVPTQHFEDTLTGVQSRAFFDHLGPMAISAAQRHGYPVAVMLFDIDVFERVNASKGRAFGDRIIAAVGRVIMSSCRTEDIVARYEGDQFAVILPHCDLSAGLLKCERVRAKITAQRTEDVRVTVSVGLAAMSGNTPRDLPALIAGAEAALQVAKSNGRNRVVTEPEAERRAAIAARLAEQSELTPPLGNSG